MMFMDERTPLSLLEEILDKINTEQQKKDMPQERYYFLCQKENDGAELFVAGDADIKYTPVLKLKFGDGFRDTNIISPKAVPAFFEKIDQYDDFDIHHSSVYELITKWSGLARFVVDSNKINIDPLKAYILLESGKTRQEQLNLGDTIDGKPTDSEPLFVTPFTVYAADRKLFREWLMQKEAEGKTAYKLITDVVDYELTWGKMLDRDSKPDYTFQVKGISTRTNVMDELRKKVKRAEEIDSIIKPYQQELLAYIAEANKAFYQRNKEQQERSSSRVVL